MKLLTIFFLVVAFLPLSGVLAQEEPCDINKNGSIDVADLVDYMSMIERDLPLPPDLPIYDPELDCDGDRLHLTLNDVSGLGLRLIHGFGWGGGQQWWLPSDSIRIPETVISPGDEIDLPVYLKSRHPLTIVQLALRYDPALLQIDDFTVSDAIPGDLQPSVYIFDGGISIIVHLTTFDDEIYYSGSLGDLHVRALEDGPSEPQTVIEFFTDPRQAFYNGVCSYDYIHDAPRIRLLFTHPTTVDGTVRIVGRDRLDLSDPGETAIALMAYPNPFNSSIEFAFHMEREGNVQVSVFDLLGRRVASLADGRFPPGRHNIVWNAGDFPSGAYFCRLADNRGQIVKRITLLK